MTKEDIIRTLARRTGLTRAQVAAVQEGLVREVREAVSRGERVYLRGLGTFERRHVPEKKARRPLENAPMVVPAHDAPHFRASREFKDAVLDAAAPED